MAIFLRKKHFVLIAIKSMNLSKSKSKSVMCYMLFVIFSIAGMMSSTIYADINPSNHNLVETNQLFDFIENHYAENFQPMAQETVVIADYWVRYYAETNTYLGSKNGLLYVYGDVFGGLKKIGNIVDLLSVSETTSLNSSRVNSLLGQLNDTGIVGCDPDVFLLNNLGENSLACFFSGANVLLNTHQDGEYGRDIQFNDDSDGHGGFSFTKLNENGNALLATATQWSCVKDNVTGLIWEVKTTDQTARDKSKKFTWYNSTGINDGGSEGVVNSIDLNEYPDYCSEYSCGTGGYNTEAYVNYINTLRIPLCGAIDWRMPTVYELQGLVSYDRINPTIDTDYFSNINSSFYWSASPTASGNSVAWVSEFYYGSLQVKRKDDLNFIRLVREGQ
jgi:hypothetical protein